MLYFSQLFEESPPFKVIKRTQTKNWKVEDYKNPPEKNIVGWRTIKTKKKSTGEPRLVKLALVKDPDTGQVKTRITSLWRKKE